MGILQDSLAKLGTLYAFSRKISIIHAARRAGALRTILLEKMVEKMLLHDHSILRLTDVLSEQGAQELDVSLIASAARSIMETANLYFHMAQRKISPDHVELRAEIMVLNEIYNEMDLTGKFGFSQDCFCAQINRWYYEGAPGRFQRFPEFTALSAREQAQITSGRKPAFQMKSPHILQEQMESAVYNLFSNSLHSLPLGLGNNSVNRTPYFQNFFRAEHLLVIALQVSRIYTAHVVKDYLDLRKRLYALLTPEEKKLLKSYLSAADLEDYIRALGAEYEKRPFPCLS